MLFGEDGKKCVNGEAVPCAGVYENGETGAGRGRTKPGEVNVALRKSGRRFLFTVCSDTNNLLELLKYHQRKREGLLADSL